MDNIGQAYHSLISFFDKDELPEPAQLSIIKKRPVGDYLRNTLIAALELFTTLDAYVKSAHVEDRKAAASNPRLSHEQLKFLLKDGSEQVRLESLRTLLHRIISTHPNNVASVDLLESHTKTGLGGGEKTLFNQYLKELSTLYTHEAGPPVASLYKSIRTVAEPGALFDAVGQMAAACEMAGQINKSKNPNKELFKALAANTSIDGVYVDTLLNWVEVVPSNEEAITLMGLLREHNASTKTCLKVAATAKNTNVCLAVLCPNDADWVSVGASTKYVSDEVNAKIAVSIPVEFLSSYQGGDEVVSKVLETLSAEEWEAVVNLWPTFSGNLIQLVDTVKSLNRQIVMENVQRVADADGGNGLRR